MTTAGTTDYLCYIPFDFDEPLFQELDILVLDHGMGIESDDIFRYTMNILLEVMTIEDVIRELDVDIFPEHVPNDSLASSLSLCVSFINYLMKRLHQYKKDLNLLTTSPVRVLPNRYTSTLELIVRV